MALLWVLTFFGLIIPSLTLNVLMWSVAIGKSHMNFMGTIADILVEDGHNVTILFVESDPDVTSSGSLRVNNLIRYSSPYVEQNEWSQLFFKTEKVFDTRTFDTVDFFVMQGINRRICQGMLEDSTFIKTLRQLKFDIVVLEMFHFCPAGIIHLAGIPKIVLASALGLTSGHSEILNLPTSLSNTPTFMTYLGSEMNFFERIYNVVFHYVNKIVYVITLYLEQRMFNNMYPDFPGLIELFRLKVDYTLLNTNEFTESTRPTLPSIRYIGGVSVKSPQPLSMDMEYILQRGEKGTILFSLGSIVKSCEMPEHIRQAFLAAFLAFPEYSFIWKEDEDSNFTMPNIYYRKWLPQVDLLADKRVKLFITHGGMNSIQESLMFGVPIIVLPIFADQDQNAAVATERGYAISLSKFAIEKDDVVRAIQKILPKDNSISSFTEKARQASRILRESRKVMHSDILKAVRLSGSERSLSHLRINASDSVVQYYNLDVYLFLCIVSFLVCSLTFKMLKCFITVRAFYSYGYYRKKLL